MLDIKKLVNQLNSLTEVEKKEFVNAIKKMYDEQGRAVEHNHKPPIIERGQIAQITLFEKLASIEHERWADWQKYLHSKCTKDSNGNLIIPKELVDRWERQIATPYNELTAKEQDSDREQVNRYWNLIINFIKGE